MIINKNTYLHTRKSILALTCFMALILFMTLPYPCRAQSPYWTGEGGRGTRVTVSEPAGKGLSTQELSLLPLIQSTLIGSFQRFSAMTVFDRQNLENVLKEQRLSMSGDFSDINYIRIGQLTNASLVVFGSINKISNNYMLELAVTDVETGERRASYPPRQVSLLALENLSAIREASADLLGQLGINLTANALQELRRAEDTARIQYENNLARGIAAQRQGTVVEALSYYFQAASFNPSLGEALNRVSTVSVGISSGNLGQAVRNRLQEHDEWRTVVQAASEFYKNHLPYEFIYSTDIKRGRIDFERRTTELSIEISLLPTDAWKTINDLRQGLSKARGNDNWNFSLSSIEPRQITVSIQIINENNTVIATASYPFRNPNEKERTNATLNFSNVRADTITDQLTVRVVSINELPAQRAGETGYIQITTLSDYNTRIARIRAAEEPARIAREAREREARETEAKRQREEAAWEKTERRRIASRLNSLGVSIGTTFMAAPSFVVTVRGTIAPGRGSFFDLGMDFGFGIINNDVDYFSLYPYARYAFFVPFALSAGGWYAGAGAGLMIQTFTFFDSGKITGTVFAVDVSTGFVFRSGINISYTLQTDFTYATNHKFSLGYAYRFK